MEFKYFGGNCLGITVKSTKLLIDPIGKSYGVTPPSFKPDISLITNTVTDTGKGEGFIVDSPGEYEVKNVSIYGVAAQKHIDKEGRKGVLYKIFANGISVLISGAISSNLDDEQREVIDHVDVLVVPVGGHGLTPDSKSATSIATMFEPSIVIPTHYDDGKIKYEIEQDKVDTFIKELGVESETQDQLKIKDSDLDPETMKIVVLNRG